MGLLSTDYVEACELKPGTEFWYAGERHKARAVVEVDQSNREFAENAFVMEVVTEAGVGFRFRPYVQLALAQ